MKKIRLLAILLAMLMIPFSMFFACDNTEELGDDDVVDDDDDGDDAPTAPIVLDDDGSNPDGGYLMYFHFNAAGDGRLNIIKPSTDTTKSESQYVLEAPYSTYLEGNNVQGGSFVVRTKDDRSFLAIERVDANTRPTLSIKVGEAFTDDIDADHMLRFDLFFENGHFGSAVDVYGGKNSAKNTFTFLTVENGDQKPVIKDAVGNVVYGDKETDKTGWIDVAILISEQTRKYDIYIDGIKQTDGVGLNSAYPAWNDYRVETYNIAIRNVGMTNTFCYIDDLCMKNGNESNLGIYKGVDGGDEFVGKVPSYVDVLSLTKEHVLDLYTEKNAGTKVKSSVFSSSLLMSNVLTITKITTAEGDNRAEDVFEDTMIDYGVETGAYDEVSYFYKEGSDEYYAAWVEVEPSSYVGGHANIQQLGKIVYDADKKDATPAVEGVYTIAANGNITFTWSEENKTYAKYDATAKTLTIYSDEACTTAVDGAVYTLYDAEPYANVAYATVNVADKIKLQVSPFFKTAKLSVTPAQGTALEGEYPCDVDGNVVTVEVDSETSFTFTYNEEDDEFVYGTGIKLNKVVEADILEDNQKYALKWANFLTGFETSGRYYPEFDAEWWANNYQNYHNFSFEF